MPHNVCLSLIKKKHKLILKNIVKFYVVEWKTKLFNKIWVNKFCQTYFFSQSKKVSWTASVKLWFPSARQSQFFSLFFQFQIWLYRAWLKWDILSCCSIKFIFTLFEVGLENNYDWKLLTKKVTFKNDILDICPRG